MAANLRKGMADPIEFVQQAEQSADVIAVSELTLDEVERFAGAGLGRTFPYSLLLAAPGGAGRGIWSRFPLNPTDELLSRPVPFASIDLPNAGYDPIIGTVHVISPFAVYLESFGTWRRGIARLDSSLEEIAKIAGPAAVIVAGDFNSTPDMRQFRDLLTNGYRDAVEQTGAGWGPTFPSNQIFPPLITIDHVLTRNATAESIHTVTIPGSDHRALLATIQIPVDPTGH